VAVVNMRERILEKCNILPFNPCQIMLDVGSRESFLRLYVLIGLLCVVQDSELHEHFRCC